MNKFICRTFENNWDLLLPECAKKKRKRKTNTTLTNLLRKRVLSTNQNQNISYNIITVDMLIFEIQGIEFDLSKTRLSYRLTKRTTKTEKSLKKYNIINFKTIRYKLTALGKIIHLIVNYNSLRTVSVLRLPKGLKRLEQQIQKN